MSMESTKRLRTTNSHGGKGGLFRRFIVPQILIIAVAGGIALIAAGNAQRDLERERLVEVVD